MSRLYENPIPGIEIIEPEIPPGVNDVLLGYRIIEVEKNCFVKPNPSRMNIGGWLLFGVLMVVFWPISCIPCCINSSYNTVQVPVYGAR